MKSILVVCEGNICRSPMAEAMFKAALPSLILRSAGLGALVGMPADETAVSLMREKRLDITSHRAEQITVRFCRSSDLVLVMSTEQRKRVQELYPDARGRVFRLGEHVDLDIPDPYRRSEAAFREALSCIEAGVEQWVSRIHRL